MYCAWVSIVYAVSGPEPFERNGVTFSSVVVTYIIIGAVGGGIVGLLRPFSTTKIGAYAIGLIVGLFGAMSIGILVAGSPLRWQLPEWGTMPIFTIVMGWLVGSELWKRNGVRSDSPNSP
jgi:hypothetical protein